MSERAFLLHICCAPCSPHPIRTLKKEFALTLFFFNPNIHPRKAYLARLKEAERLASFENIPLLAGDYDPGKWIQSAREWKNEPERGKRCEFCIGWRLDETAKKADELGMRLFGSVLTVSRLKSAIMVNRLGEKARERFAGKGILFHEADWKKQNGFDLSVAAAKELGLTRQDYCGCVYSLRASRERKKRNAESARCEPNPAV